MQKVALATILIASAFCSGLGVSSSRASDIVWEVQSPFRFFKKTSSYEVQERAFSAVRGDPNSPLPSNIVWRLERRLNDPDCRDRSSPTACAETARAHYEASRLGWASQTVEVNCYDRNVRPRRYSTVCARQYSWGTAKEDYILPEAHTVVVHLSADDLAKAGSGDCTWTWQPRRPGGKAETQRQACKNKLVIKRLPLSLDRKVSGVSVRVQLPDGREIADPNVVKVITDLNGDAVYFSRLPIPYHRDGAAGVHYKHTGLYLYRRDFLLAYPTLPVGPLEQAERLEQLRALENGLKIRVVETDYESLGVDTPEDLERVSSLFEASLFHWSGNSVEEHG